MPFFFAGVVAAACRHTRAAVQQREDVAVYAMLAP